MKVVHQIQRQTFKREEWRKRMRAFEREREIEERDN